MAEHSSGQSWHGLVRYALCPEPLCKYTEEEEDEYEDWDDVILASWFGIKLLFVLHALCGSPIFKLLGAIVRCVSPLCQRKPKGKGKAANLGVSNKFSHTANGWVLEGQEVQPAAAPLHGPPTVLPGRPSHGQVDAPSAQRDSSGSITMSHDAGCHSWKRGKSIKDRYVNTPGIHSSVPDQHHQPLASPLLPQLAPMLDLSMRPRFFTPCATSVKSAAAQGLGPVSESKASSPAGSARSSKSPAQRPLFQDTPDVASSAHGAAAYAWAVDQGAPEELLVEPMSTALKDSQQEEDPDVSSPRDKIRHDHCSPRTTGRPKGSLHLGVVSHAEDAAPAAAAAATDAHMPAAEVQYVQQATCALEEEGDMYQYGHQEQPNHGSSTQVPDWPPLAAADQRPGFDISLGGWAAPAQQPDTRQTSASTHPAAANMYAAAGSCTQLDNLSATPSGADMASCSISLQPVDFTAVCGYPMGSSAAPQWPAHWHPTQCSAQQGAKQGPAQQAAWPAQYSSQQLSSGQPLQDKEGGMPLAQCYFQQYAEQVPCQSAAWSVHGLHGTEQEAAYQRGYDQQYKAQRGTQAYHLQSDDQQRVAGQAAEAAQGTTQLQLAAQSDPCQWQDGHTGAQPVAGLHNATWAVQDMVKRPTAAQPWEDQTAAVVPPMCVCVDDGAAQAGAFLEEGADQQAGSNAGPWSGLAHDDQDQPQAQPDWAAEQNTYNHVAHEPGPAHQQEHIQVMGYASAFDQQEVHAPAHAWAEMHVEGSGCVQQPDPAVGFCQEQQLPAATNGCQQLCISCPGLTTETYSGNAHASEVVQPKHAAVHHDVEPVQQEWGLLEMAVPKPEADASFAAVPTQEMAADQRWSVGAMAAADGTIVAAAADEDVVATAQNDAEHMQLPDPEAHAQQPSATAVLTEPAAGLTVPAEDAGASSPPYTPLAYNLFSPAVRMSRWPRLSEAGPPSACASPHLPTSSHVSPECTPSERAPSVLEDGIVCSIDRSPARSSSLDPVLGLLSMLPDEQLATDGAQCSHDHQTATAEPAEMLQLSCVDAEPRTSSAAQLLVAGFGEVAQEQEQQDGAADMVGLPPAASGVNSVSLWEAVGLPQVLPGGAEQAAAADPAPALHFPFALAYSEDAGLADVQLYSEPVLLAADHPQQPHAVSEQVGPTELPCVPLPSTCQVDGWELAADGSAELNAAHSSDAVAEDPAGLQGLHVADAATIHSCAAQPATAAADASVAVAQEVPLAMPFGDSQVTEEAVSAEMAAAVEGGCELAVMEIGADVVPSAAADAAEDVAAEYSISMDVAEDGEEVGCPVSVGSTVPAAAAEFVGEIAGPSGMESACGEMAASAERTEAAWEGAEEEFVMQPGPLLDLSEENQLEQCRVHEFEEAAVEGTGLGQAASVPDAATPGVSAGLPAASDWVPQALEQATAAPAAPEPLAAPSASPMMDVSDANLSAAAFPVHEADAAQEPVVRSLAPTALHHLPSSAMWQVEVQASAITLVQTVGEGAAEEARADATLDVSIGMVVENVGSAACPSAELDLVPSAEAASEMDVVGEPAGTAGQAEMADAEEAASVQLRHEQLMQAEQAGPTTPQAVPATPPVVLMNSAEILARVQSFQQALMRSAERLARASKPVASSESAGTVGAGGVDSTKGTAGMPAAAPPELTVPTELAGPEPTVQPAALPAHVVGQVAVVHEMPGEMVQHEAALQNVMQEEVAVEGLVSSGSVASGEEFGDFCDASMQVDDAPWLQVLSQAPTTPAPSINPASPSTLWGQPHTPAGAASDTSTSAAPAAATTPGSAERVFTLGSTIVTKDYVRRRTTGSMLPRSPQHHAAGAWAAATPMTAFSAALDAVANVVAVTPASATVGPSSNCSTGSLVFDKCGRPVILRNNILFTPPSRDSSKASTPATDGLPAMFMTPLQAASSPDHHQQHQEQDQSMEQQLQSVRQSLSFPVLGQEQEQTSEDWGPFSGYRAYPNTFHNACCGTDTAHSPAATPAPSSPVHGSSTSPVQWHTNCVASADSGTAYSLPPSSPVQFAGLFSTAASPAKSEFLAFGTCAQSPSAACVTPRAPFGDGAATVGSASRSHQSMLKGGRRPGEFKIEDRRALSTRYVNTFSSLAAAADGTPPRASVASILPVPPSVGARTTLFVPSPAKQLTGQL